MPDRSVGCQGKAVEVKFESKTLNIQHRTLNTRCGAGSVACVSSMLGFGCSLFDVSSTPKTISPCPTFRSNRDKWGMGVRHCSLSRTGIRRALFRGCRLPDAILHGKRSFRPRSRAVQRLAVAGFRVRLFSSLQLVVAPPACEPGQDTPAIFFRVLTIGTGSATAFDGAFARCHGSRLFTLKLPFISQSSGVVFNIAGAWKFFTRPAEPRVLPGACAPFVRLSAFFFWRSQLFILNPPESSAPC